MMKVALLACVLVSVVSTAPAADRAAADYAVPSDVLDAGGHPTASAVYSSQGSLGGIAGASASGSLAVIVNSGYIGQLGEVTPPVATPCSPPNPYHLTGGGNYCPDDVGQGLLLPSTSIDQYAATLGKWFGLSDSNLRTVLPNLMNYGLKEATRGFL